MEDKIPEIVEDKIPEIIDDSKSVIVEGVKFLPIYLTKKDEEPKIVHLDQREERFIGKLIKTRSLVEASEEVGIAISTAKKWLRRPNIRAVIEQAIQKAAIRAGTDLDETIVWLRQCRDGKIDINETQLKCGQTLAKVLKPSGGGVNVQINNNNGPQFESPYKNFTAEELTAAAKERLGAFESRPANPA